MRSRLGLFACCMLTLSCAALTGLSGPAPESPAAAPRQAATGLLDLKGVIHCHSYLSHDSRGTVAEIGAALAEVRADFVVMTDHITPVSVVRGQRGMRDGVLWMVGAELSCPGGAGSVLAFPLRHYVRPWPTLPELVADVTAQGGICLLGHPERWTELDVRGFVGMEAVNLHAAAVNASKAEVLLTGLFLPIGSMMQLLAQRPAENLRRYDEVVQRHPFALIGGNDAHANIRVFGPLGGTIGDYREVFRTLTTHVLAATFDEVGIVGALRAGRSYVAFDLQRDATGFDFHAVDATGVVSMGGVVKCAAQGRLAVHVPAPGRILLLRNGAPWAASEGVELAVPLREPGAYRVEVEHLDGQAWIYSSAILVKP